MSRPAFVDTSGWLVVLIKREPRHEAAVAAYSRLLAGGTRFVTTNLVAAEMHALVVRSRGARAGVAFLDQLHADPVHEVVYADRDHEAAATDRWLRVFHDHGFSLTDAVSFELMRRQGLRAAFALDRHFAAAGYELLL